MWDVVGFLVVIILCVVICAGIIVLQVILSKKESRWPGLILPAILFSMSVVIIFGLMVFSTVQHEARDVRLIESIESTRIRLEEISDTVIIDVELELDWGAELEQYEREALIRERLEQMEAISVEYLEHLESVQFVRSMPIASIIFVFLLYNVPTAILLAVYAACRGNRNKMRDLQRMSVQDL